MYDKDDARDVIRDITTAAADLEMALAAADTMLQSDHAPKPWDQWDAAVDAVQGAMCDISRAGDFGMALDAVEDALDKFRDQLPEEL